MRIASGRDGSSPSSASSSSDCPLPATPAMPKISPARTVKLIASSPVPKASVPGSDSPSTTNLSAPNARPGAFCTSLRPAPIIFSAIEREVSSLGSQVATTLPARRIVAVSQSALISCELVRDVEDRAAFRGELAQHDEQLLHLLRGEHRGRLVHDQQRGVEQQRPHDLDALPLAHREGRDDAVRIEQQPVLLSSPRGSAPRARAPGSWRPCRARCSRAPSAPRTARSAGTPCRCRAGGRPWDWATVTGLAVPADLAGIGLQDAVDHLDQRRLAGAVLAEQRVDLARAGR